MDIKELFTLVGAFLIADVVKSFIIAVAKAVIKFSKKDAFKD